MATARFDEPTKRWDDGNVTFNGHFSDAGERDLTWVGHGPSSSRSSSSARPAGELVAHRPTTSRSSGPAGQ